MATANEHLSLYQELRASVLTRFFAYSRYFRANHIYLENVLGAVHSSKSQSSPDHDDPTVNCGDSTIVHPSTYQSATDLSKDGVERWRVAEHTNDNPLMYSSHLIIALAIEYSFGHIESLPIIRLAFESIGSLYKFKGDHYDGYILRWDPVTCDHWVTADDKSGKPHPLYCCDYFLDHEVKYLYCTPLDQPGYVPYQRDPNDSTAIGNDNDPARKDSLTKYRFWEPSMDEIIGLVLAYDIAYYLVDDASLRFEIRRQVNNLGDYLAEHGYLLVRPCGGFACRGASGVLPAFEYPFGQVFERITGNPYSSRTSFEDALNQAGVWPSIAAAVNRASILGAAIGLVAGAYLGGAIGYIVGIFIGAFLGAVAGWIAGRAKGIDDQKDAFDVQNLDGRGEFVGAYLLKLLPARMRFTLFMSHAHGFGPKSSARSFPQFIGLTALADKTATTVKDAYLNQVPDAHAAGAGSKPPEPRGEAGNTGFAEAVAVALGATNEEPDLRQWLDESYDACVNSNKRDIQLVDNEDGKVHELNRAYTENPLNALEYMACLALSWNAVRQKGTSPTGSVLPGHPSNVGPFKKPTVPAAAIQQHILPALGGLSAISGATTSTDYTHGTINDQADVDAFPSDPSAPARADQSKPPDPQPELPPKKGHDVFDVQVKESDSWVDSNITIFPNDSFAIVPGGKIWAGVWATGENGPAGWNNIDNDSKFPGRNTHPYCLLYMLLDPNDPPPLFTGNVADLSAYVVAMSKWSSRNPWKTLGEKLSSTQTWTTSALKLVLRTNDDTPGNGSGAFVIHVDIDRST